MSKIKDAEKKADVEGIYNALVMDIIRISAEIRERALRVGELSNIKAFDSLHLASAEMGADILLTTDIKFLKGSQKIAPKIEVRNPVDFVMEVFGHDESDDKYS